MPVHFDGVNLIFHPKKIANFGITDVIGTYVYDVLIYYDKTDRPNLFTKVGQLKYIVEIPMHKIIYVNAVATAYK